LLINLTANVIHLRDRIRVENVREIVDVTRWPQL